MCGLGEKGGGGGVVVSEFFTKNPFFSWAGVGAYFSIN